jgi:hypothetical protein
MPAVYRNHRQIASIYHPQPADIFGSHLGLAVVFHSLKLICAQGRRLPDACGFVLTSVAPEQLDDHLGRQRVLPVSDKEPGGRLVHTALDEPRAQLVV